MTTRAGDQAEATHTAPFDYSRAEPEASVAPGTNGHRGGDGRTSERATADRTQADAEGPAGAEGRADADGTGGGNGEDTGVTDAAKGFVERTKRSVDHWQRKHRLVGMPLAVVKKFGDDTGSDLAALVAYYSFLSVFPLLLVFLTVVGFVLGNNPDLQRSILDSALAQFPVVGDQLRSNVTTVRGSGLALAVGIVVTLWAGMGATMAMQNAMNTIWRVPIRQRQGFLIMRLRALVLLVVLALFVVGSFGLSTVATATADLGLLGRVAALALAFAFNVAMFLVSFKILTDHPVRWRQLLPGAVLAGAIWVVLQSFGTAYVQHVVTGASQTYGAFAVVLGLIAYLYLQAQLTLYAAELNTVLVFELWPRGLDPDDLTDADRRALERNAKVEERVPAERIDVELHPENDASSPADQHVDGDRDSGVLADARRG